MEEDEQAYFLLPKPSDSDCCFTRLISLQADLIYSCMVSITSPFFSLLSIASESYHRAEETKENVESAVHKVPSNITYGATILLKKLGLGFLAAAQVGMVLLAVLILAALIGVGLVQLWVEEPVFVRERLHFDYTDAHPKAVLSFGSGVNSNKHRKKQTGVPVGHTFYVSLVLLMPESDYNRDIGVFQLTAELLSVNGRVIAKSSQPCMLQFRSFPIRLVRTFVMGIPLLLGISGETQKITIRILKHKEDSQKTAAIRVTLCPRAGTSYLPQIYEAEILLKSHLPWKKHLIHNWKWTFCVWMSLYIYMMLLLFVMCCCRPLIFPVTPAYFHDGTVREEPKEQESTARDDQSEISELLRKWRRSRNKRKSIFLHGTVPETIGSSASTITVTGEDTTSAAVEDDVSDSESVCLGS
ncbi:Seipin [Quillaja saponaria]|uniref:Seipin n=1 Tax=Quillaja saponaria TaxID=32244 RepID=A0AAD7QB44_QUISA|nr:Seipin [Quillaja saponaria]